MERTHKTWGEKANVFCNDTCEVSVLRLMPNQRCSWHKHQAKYNLFYTLEGEVYIKTEWGISRVKQGEIFTTKPGEYHEFQTYNEPALLIEVMYVQYEAEDIQREKVGGPLNDG